MELSALAALVKVVQAGSFTRAAEAMHTQKAHLSRPITNLERELGVRLLERTTRSLSLTEMGRGIFERAVGILGAVDDPAREVGFDTDLQIALQVGIDPPKVRGSSTTRSMHFRRKQPTNRLVLAP